MAARKDGASNRSAGRAERLREREASSCMADLHWEFRRRLPLDYSTHTCRRRSVHLTVRSTALPTGYQRMRLSQHGSVQSETGCLWGPRQSHAGIGAQNRMSQSDVWPFEYSVVEASSRYKQEFTASVKLHTSLARAIWDDRSANVPLQTGVFLLPSRTSLRLLPVLCMMHAELVSARPPAVLPLLSGAAHTSVSVSHSLSLPCGNRSGTACW